VLNVSLRRNIRKSRATSAIFCPDDDLSASHVNTTSYEGSFPSPMLHRKVRFVIGSDRNPRKLSQTPCISRSGATSYDLFLTKCIGFRHFFPDREAEKLNQRSADTPATLFLTTGTTRPAVPSCKSLIIGIWYGKGAYFRCTIHNALCSIAPAGREVESGGTKWN
jgi:hypothetical protein